MHSTGKSSWLRRGSAFVFVLSVLAVSMADDIPRLSMPEKAQKCVAPVEIMRRDHMKFLLQQRDATVHQGVRTKKFSLSGCINCHAHAGSDGETVRSDSPEYFCTGCHIYAAVKIDCFECHSDKPIDVANR
jgi:predicted CXXCH cytochrome family protein